MKATAIKADIDGCRPQWRSQQVGSQISGTGVAGSGGGQGHGRKLQADDAPTECMEVRRFASESATDVKCMPG